MYTTGVPYIGHKQKSLNVYAVSSQQDNIGLNLPNNVPCLIAKQEAFEALNAETTKQESGFEKANRLFYLALPPSVFAPVTSNIKLCCMSSR